MKQAVLLLLLCSMYSASLNGCRQVEVKWQCETEREPVRQNCSSSLDAALNVIAEQEAVCQNRLRVNLTLYSQYESLSSNFTFSNNKFSQVAIRGMNDTVIQCEARKASLQLDGYYGKDNSLLMIVHIKHIRFQSCGPGTHIHVKAAIFINNHCQIEISHISVENSIGVGLSIVDMTGNVSITYSRFYHNVLENGYGGGIHLTVANQTENRSVIFINNCTFEENKATFPRPKPYLSHGGAIYLQYRNNSQNGIVHIGHSQFIGNEAERGGGISAIFGKSAWKNELVISYSNFSKNGASLSSYNFRTVGGGVAITVYSNASSNKAVIANCNFTENAAPWGGGIVVHSQPSQSTAEKHNSLNISKCRFTNNRGRIGAAIHIYCSPPPNTPQQCNAQPVIDRCLFSNNSDLKLDLVPPSMNQSQQSVVHISRFPTFLSTTVDFFNNFGTPLYVHQTSVIVCENAVLNFRNNTAQNGGAISLYGSWITVSSNSQFSFFNNTVTGSGGAIYVYMTEELYLPYSFNCFIKNINGVTNHKRWTSCFIFGGNSNHNISNAIYATSILPCVYKTLPSLDDNIRDTFCKWSNWNFSNETCSNLIHTSPRNFSSTLKNIKLYPGIPSDHYIYAVDDLGHALDDFFVDALVKSPKNGTKVRINNRTLSVYGNTNTTATIQLQLTENRRLSKSMSVTLQQCPPGFSFHSDSKSCICMNSEHIKCEVNDSKWNASIAAGFCMSYSSIPHVTEHKHLLLGQCLFTAGLYNNISDNRYSPITYLPLPADKDEFDDIFCGKLNRTGMQCGICKENYSIDVLSYTLRCRHCSGSVRNWLIYLTADGLSPLLFFSVILILHISLTNGPLNGLIFFSQVITVSIEIVLLQDSWMHTSFKQSDYLTGAMTRIYSVWSLDFLRLAHGYHSLCLGTHLKVMHVLALRYLSALYPLCFLIVAFFVIELHARNCHLLVWLWKLCFLCARFRQAWKARTSIVDAFAAFILLSYVKLVRISIILVTYAVIQILDSEKHKKLKVMNYDPTVLYLSHEHIPFWLIAGAILLTFGLVPPFLLTFYQFKYFQRFLNKYNLNGHGLRIFMDAFQGCYKDGRNGGPDRRYFAGFYFIFRLVVFSIFDMTVSIATAYAELLTAFIIFGIITSVVRPYKVSFYNYLDVFFFNLLAVIMALQFLAFYRANESDHLSIFTPSFTFTLILIPFVYKCLFVLYWVAGRAPRRVKGKFLHALRSIQKTVNRNPRTIPINNYSILENVPDSLPDRLEHSSRYKTSID